MALISNQYYTGFKPCQENMYFKENMTKKMEKLRDFTTIAVVDGSNVMSTSKKFDPKQNKYVVERDWTIDLKKLYRYLTDSKGASKVIFFGPYYPNNKGSERLIRKLESIGYINRTRKAVPHYTYEKDQSGNFRKIKTHKGNVDGMIPVDICLGIDEFDELLFLSGDGDFIYLLEKIMERGKIVRVYAFGDVTSQDIKKLFKGNFIDLVDFKNMLGYKK